MFLKFGILSVLTVGMSSAALLSLNKPVTANTVYSSGCETFLASNVTDGAFNDTSTGGCGQWSFWLGADGSGATAAFVVDLQADYSIDDVQIQTTHNRGFNDRGTTSFSLYVSETPVTLGTPATYGTQVVNNGSLSWVGCCGPIPIDDFTIAPINGRYVTLVSLAAHNNNSGLNEISVFGSAAGSVPEPGTFLLAGIALAGLWTRRRQA